MVPDKLGNDAQCRFSKFDWMLGYLYLSFLCESS